MIFFRHIEAENGIIRFEALENDILAGECILDLRGKNALVSSLTSDKDKPYITEGLIKAAYNYAALKNYYMAECTCNNSEPLLMKLGFQKINGTYIQDIPSILMGTCCKK